MTIDRAGRLFFHGWGWRVWDPPATPRRSSRGLILHLDYAPGQVFGRCQMDLRIGSGSVKRLEILNERLMHVLENMMRKSDDAGSDVQQHRKTGELDCSLEHGWPTVKLWGLYQAYSCFLDLVLRMEAEYWIVCPGCLQRVS